MLATLAVVLYVVSFPLCAYDNRNSVLNVVFRPEIYRQFPGLMLIGMRAIAWGPSILFFFAFGWPIALAAAGIHWIFNVTTFNNRFDEQVKYYASIGFSAGAVEIVKNNIRS